jgi:hypothetical protein
MNLPNAELDPLRRRALINAAIASLVTLVLGLTLQTLFGGGSEGDGTIAGPTSSPRASPTAPACIATWEVVQSADPGEPGNALTGVTAISAREAWSVGGAGADVVAPEVPIVERWDGNAWTAEAVPNVGTETNGLVAVDASEPNDVWAVGRTASFTGDRPYVVRYDGTLWEAVSLPPDVTGVLTGVEAIAPNDVWVVGYTGDVATAQNRALVLHWDGELWANVDLGRAAGTGASLLRDISAVAADEMWAVGELRGRPLILRSDGRRWERLETEVRGEMHAVEPVARNDVWAVGVPIHRYDGEAWDLGANVRRDGLLFGVAAVSPTDVWAVGIRPGKGTITRALVLRYDGERWGPVEGSTIGGSEALLGIDALPDGTVLAVGYRDVRETRRTLAIRGDTCVSN